MIILSSPKPKDIKYKIKMLILVYLCNRYLYTLKREWLHVLLTIEWLHVLLTISSFFKKNLQFYNQILLVDMSILFSPKPKVQTLIPPILGTISSKVS